MAVQDQKSERLEKIREIIFGEQMEDYESRLNQLNGEINQEKEVTKTYVSSYFDKLSVRQDKEQLMNQERIEKIQLEMESLKTEFSSSLKRLEENFLVFQKEIKESYVTKQDLSQHFHSLIENLTKSSVENRPNN